jgi:hypothetical protein
MTDFQILPIESEMIKTRLLKIPAPLACYWLGQSELESAQGSES